MIESPKYLNNFISIQQAAQKLWFTLFRNIFYAINIQYLCKLRNYIG